MKLKKPYYGWIIVVCGMFIMATLHYVSFNSFGLFVVPVTTDMGISRSAFSLTTTISSLVGMVISPIAGRLMAKKSVRKMMFLGILFGGFGIAAQGLVTAVWQLYILAAFNAFCTAFSLSLPVSVLMTRWFKENRSLAISLVFVGVSLGGIIFSTPLTSLILNKGWRSAYELCGLVIALLIAPLTLLLMRDHPQTEEDGPTAAAEIVKNDSFSTKELHKTAHFWIFILGVFCMAFCIGPLYQMPAYIQSLGYTAELAGRIASMYSLINIFAKLAMGVLFDKFGMKAGTCFGMLGNIFCFVFMLLAFRMPVMPMVFIFASAFGIGLTCQSIPAPSLTSGIFGTKHYSIIYGEVSIFTGLAGGIANYILAWLFDITGNYFLGWVISLVISVIGLICLLWAAARPKEV